MRRIAACLLVAAATSCAGYCTEKALVPLLTSCFDVTAGMSHLIPDLIPYWHFRNSHFRKS